MIVADLRQQALGGIAFLDPYGTGHPSYILASRYNMPQFIQPRGGAEIALEHHHVSPGRIVGESSRPGIRQRGIDGFQFLRRIENFFVVAEIFHFDA